MKALSRHTIDLVARAVVSGRRGYGKKVDEMADSIAGLMKNKLRAAGAKGAERAKHIRQTSVKDPELLEVLFKRAEKHLAWTALSEGKLANPQPR